MATSKRTASARTAEARNEQFPAKTGEPEAEVEQRSADGAEGTRHVKEFVVLGRDWALRADDEAHEANKAATTNEAIQRGLHPRGDVSFDGEAQHADGQSVILTYSVETVPASVDATPQETTTPRAVLTDGDEG